MNNDGRPNPAHQQNPEPGASGAAPVTTEIDDSHRERLLYAARVLRGIADLRRHRPLGDLWSEALVACGAIKIVLGIKDEDCEALGLAAKPGEAPSVVLGTGLAWLHRDSESGRWVECGPDAPGAVRFAALPHAADDDGMPVSQEPKYGIRDNRLYNRASGEFIPQDEPVFIFRARDIHAADGIYDYGQRLADSRHWAIVVNRSEDFRVFARAHPERMKEPDTGGVAGAGRVAS